MAQTGHWRMCVLVLVCASVAGCGTAKTQRTPPSGSHRTAPRATVPASNAGPHTGKKNDGDRDWDNNDDDNDVRDFGHRATTGEKRSIIALIERYHAATAKDDGKAACALINRTLMLSFAEEVSGVKSAAGAACGQVVRSLLVQSSGDSDAGLAKVDVLQVRVKSTSGLALVRSQTGEERYMPVDLERGGWRIGTLYDLGMI